MYATSAHLVAANVGSHRLQQKKHIQHLSASALNITLTHLQH
jgi:hypothetical protein